VDLGREKRPLGKHAFYSNAPPGSRRSIGRSRAVDSLKEPANSGRDGGLRGAAKWDRVGLGSSGVLGRVVVDCSSCKARSEVGVGQFVALHLPFWLWRPGRGYARRMTCPACARRAWLSASWRPWER
jgi:hypothetical protein